MENKVSLSLSQVVDDPNDVEHKIDILKGWIVSSRTVVVHCGAGISTSCGIPDFRGPNGVWTKELEESKKKRATCEKIDCQETISFDQSLPSYTHR